MSSTAFPVIAEVFPAEVFGPTCATLTVAARTLTPSDLSTAMILWSSSQTASVPFSFDFPIGDIEDRPADWQLAVSGTTPAGDFVRYVLVPPVSGEILYPRYEGQTIPAAFTLEIWSVAGEATANVTETVLTPRTYTRETLYVILNNGATTSGSNTTL